MLEDEISPSYTTLTSTPCKSHPPVLLAEQSRGPTGGEFVYYSNLAEQSNKPRNNALCASEFADLAFAQGTRPC